MLRKSREHIVVKLFDHMNEIVPGQTQLCVEISIEDLLQCLGGIFALIHQIHTTNEGAQHNVWSNAVGHVLRQCLKISRHESIQVGVQQCVVEVKQQCEGHLGSGRAA